MSRGTWRATGGFGMPRDAALRARRTSRSRSATSRCIPFTVAHDAAEPLQLRCSDGGARLVVLTDLGSITAHMIDTSPAATRSSSSAITTWRCSRQSRYPPSLKARIGGRFGHLSNATAGRDPGALRERPAAARRRRAPQPREQPARTWRAPRWRRASAATGEAIVIADPFAGFDWLRLG
jgi:hypothetical protein